MKELDMEYGTGSVWLGESLVASSTRTPNDGAKSESMMTGKGSPPARVDLEKPRQHESQSLQRHFWKPVMRLGRDC